MPVSFLQQVFALAPPGESPYAFAMDIISRAIPKKAHWFFVMLEVGSVINALNLVMNLLCIWMIGARRKLGETSSYWIVRLRYDHSSGIPYLVPNALMAFLSFNGIFALLMQPYIWVNYVAYKNRAPDAETRFGLFFWYGFIFVFDGSGMWISAFGTFYATLLPQLLISNKINNSRFFVHPVFLNAMCFGLPAALFVTQVITSALSQIAWRNLVVLEYTILDNLQLLDRQWSTNKTGVNKMLLNNTLTLGDSLIEAAWRSRYAFIRNAVTSSAWYMLCFVFFTPSAVWLLYVLRRTITHKLQFVTRIPTSDVDIQFPVPLEQLSASDPQAEAGNHDERRPEDWKPPGSLRLKPSYLSLGGESSRVPGSRDSSPTSAAFLAIDTPSRAVTVGLEHNGQPDLTTGHPGLGDKRDHSHRPHDPGGRGGSWELNVASTSATASKKLETAYYSAKLQFTATALTLAIASGSWLWAAIDDRVTTNPDLHAVAILLTVWVYPILGIIANVFICIRLRAIGFQNTHRSKLMVYLHDLWASSSRSGQSSDK